MAKTAATGMTPCETQIWKFMLRFQTEHQGLAPSMKEIADACGFGTISAVGNHLSRLARKGAVMNRNRRYLALRGKEPAGAKKP